MNPFTPLSAPVQRYMHRHLPMVSVCGMMCALLCSAAGCGRRPSDVLSDEEMASLLTDMYKAEAYASSDPDYSFSDSMRMVLRQGVLADHHATEADFNRSLDWYGHNIDRLGDIYDDVSERLEKESTAPAKTAESTGSGSQTLWDGAVRLSLTPSHAADRFSFDIPGAQLTNPRDNEIIWEFTTPVLPGRITSFMGADYADGSFSYSARTFTTPGNANISLTLDKGKKLVRVFGQSTYIPVHKETVFVDSIRVMARPSRTPGLVPMK